MNIRKLLDESEKFHPTIGSGDKYAVALVIGGRKVSPIEGYPTEELLEKGYETWSKMAADHGLTEPVRVMFVNSENNSTSYGESMGRCILTDFQLAEMTAIN